MEHGAWSMADFSHVPCPMPHAISRLFIIILHQKNQSILVRSEMFEVYLGIGGNLGDRLKNISTAIELISQKIAVPKKISSIYISEPWGFYHKKYFANAVLMLNTEMSVDEVFNIITGIETKMKRQRTGACYEGRTMDIDILFYGKEIVKTDNLTIPHPKLHERLFVLMPMSEIAGDYIHPVMKKNIIELLKICPDTSKVRILYL